MSAAIKFTVAVVAVFLFVSLYLVAQEQSMPTPSPQHQRMSYFAGNWTAEGMMKLSPKGNPAPFSLTETGEWESNDHDSQTKIGRIPALLAEEGRKDRQAEQPGNVRHT